MLIELFYPIMPGFAVLFVVLNIFQLHFIVTKLARRTNAEPCTKSPESRRESKKSEPPVSGATRENWWISELKWWLSQLWHPSYAVLLLVATVLLFSAVFMLPGARVTATVVLPLNRTSVILSFLAATKLYYTPAFVSHVWLASLLFVVQAMIKYWRDRKRVDNWVCYPVDDRVPQVFESITLILGMLSFLIGIATPQMLGQLR